ncbi:MAG: insulinase family protein [Gemmatimonas sp.]
MGAATRSALAQTPPPAAASSFDPFRLDAPLPADPAVRAGVLPNGLHYYIRRNGKPEKRVELRLVVNTGSVLETDEQRGLAHFLEHMAFNGTKSFPKTEIIKYLETIGVRFGADLNANTSFDETIYILPVPTDSAAILEKSFLFLSEIASNITFDSLQVVGERGVVLEEWRGGLGADERIRDQQLPIFLAGSRYADRLPIGLPSIIEGANPAPLRQFWKTWYRPDLMAVVAVGDVEPARLQTLISKYFGTIPKALAPKARLASTVPNVDTTRISILKDKELTNTQLSVRWQQSARTDKTVGDYRRSLVEQLQDAMLNQRLDEIAQQPTAPYLNAGAGHGNFVRSMDIYVLSAVPKEGMALQTLQALLTESERVRQHGFLQSELDRVRTNLLRGYERAFDERDKTTSDNFVEQYIANFLNGESFPGIAYETDLVRNLMPKVTLDEVNALAREPRTAANRTVALTSPEKSGLAVPTDMDIIKVLNSAAGATVTAYAENVAAGALVPTAPSAGKVVGERTIADVGLTEWTLSNGVRVFVKPTDYKADEIVMRAWSPGGLSLLPDADVLRAQQAPDAMARSGLGNYSLVDLGKKLTGKAVRVSAFIDELNEGLMGTASPKDLETMMQLIWLRLEAPRADTLAFQSMIQQYTAALANKDADPQSVFSDTVQVTLAQGNPRFRPLNVQRLQELNLSRMEEIYRDRLSDATDLTFVFVGTIDVAAFKPLVEQWIGALPASGRKEIARDVGPKLLNGTVEKTVKKGVEPQSTTVMMVAGEAPWTREQAYIASSLGQLLEMRLLDRLREAMGGTYGVSVDASISRAPRQEFQVGIQFGSAPTRADALYKAVLQEMDSLKRVPPSAAEVERVREQQRRELEVARKQNGYWLSALSTKIEFGDDPSTVMQAEQLIAALTPAQLVAAARVYLNTANVARFVLVPAAAGKKP